MYNYDKDKIPKVISTQTIRILKCDTCGISHRTVKYVAIGKKVCPKCGAK